MAISIVISPRAVFASTEFKPPLSWQRSAEDPATIITETGFAQTDKLQSALQSSYLDPGQTVFDNGQFTPEPNKSTATAAGASWASWLHNYPCFQSYELRRFQAKFTLSSFDPGNIEKVKLISPYYPGDIFPINDNAYIYINGHQIAAVGTHYIGADQGGPSAETDKWFVSGDFGTTPVQFLKIGTNTIDIITEEVCNWGGMGKVDLVMVLKAPLGPAPFLDLPWDYKSQRKSFDRVALNPFSWFDHEYPLQNIPCCVQRVMKYTGEAENDFYRSHNGYDYGSDDGVVINTPVLAAASGTATFVAEAHSGGAGNVIKIDHGNGYQTWYEHLQVDGLIISDENGKVFVNKGQVIGKVGMTGNTNGPHIHFSVFKDTNNDKSFTDEFPFGVTDPLGWEGDPGQDPWHRDKGGTQSFNLFIARSQPQSNNIPASGGSLVAGDTTITVPTGATDKPFSLTLENGPFESISNLVQSVVPSFFLNAIDNLNQKIKRFSAPIHISYNYSSANLSNINENSLKLYSFNEDTSQWDPIATTLDTINKIASGETLHFSQFALMGQVKDLTAPTTSVVITGEKGNDNWYRSNVSVQLNGKDNNGGIGLQYTLYTLNDSDWFEYKEPLVFDKEGSYKITYQSFDKAENTEERKSVQFNIDKTPPEAKVFIDQAKQDLIISGIDANQTIVTRTKNPTTKKKDDAVYVVTDQAGNMLRLDVRERDKEKKNKFQVYSLRYNNDPPIIQPKNYFNVEYREKKEKFNVIEQNFQIKDEIKIRIKYDSKKNQSTIITKQSGKEKIKEAKPGLVLLQLTTNKGTLEYSY